MRRLWLALLLCVLSAPLAAQQPVPVGQGSVAEYPPPAAGKVAADMVSATARFTTGVTGAPNRPIPTNQWWTALITDGSHFGGKLWAYPLTVFADAQGLNVAYPTTWNADGTTMELGVPLRVRGELADAPPPAPAAPGAATAPARFKPADARALAWSDWTLTMRLAQDTTHFVDATFGHGLPYVWLESTGVTLRVDLDPQATCFGDDGQALKLPAAADHLGVTQDGRSFGVFAPPGTQVTRDAAGLQLSFAGGARYLVLAALPRPADLATFAKYAYAVPRRSELRYTYDPVAATVATTWHLETTPLRGSEHATIQGWLPHHYRDTTHALGFADGFTYATPRGALKCSIGDTFAITYAFAGLLPWLPAPAPTGQPHDYDAARLHGYLAQYATSTGYGGDTYWGGKDVLRGAQFGLMATLLHDPVAAPLREHARAALTDWYTYTPGEKEHFFARYPNWHALVGFNESYGSAQFSDNHFHYGYFTAATALLGLQDPQWLHDYGPVARLVAKQYANWQRDDPDFPYFRTFDLWGGHSHAGGFSSPGGNNQESSSEAMQSWAGLFLLGSMLEDKEMRDAGALGYAMEARGTLEYWFNVHGDVLPPQYQHPIACIVWSGGQVYATYFTGDRAWFHGIQCLPATPWLRYLYESPGLALRELKAAINERAAQAGEGKGEISSMGGALGNVVLGIAAQTDPDWVAEQLDALWAQRDPVATDPGDAAPTVYYLTHATRSYGRSQPDWHMDVPTSEVFLRPAAADGKGPQWTYAACNPGARPVFATVYQGTTPKGRLYLPPRELVVAHTLLPLAGAAPGPGALLGVVPAPGATQVARDLHSLFVACNVAMTPAALATATIQGPGVHGLSPVGTDAGQILELRLEGQVQAGASYTVTLPATLPGLGQPWTFTIAPEPPLTLFSSQPRDDEARVAADRQVVELTFSQPVALASLADVALTGPGVTASTLAAGSDPRVVRLTFTGKLQPDAAYALTLPATAASTGGATLGAARTVTFTTTPLPCPPWLYRDVFSGGGCIAAPGVTVDFADRTAPHAGRTAIKVTTGDKGGSIIFLAGPGERDAGRVPIDLSAYDRLECWIKSSSPSLWIKFGHPVYDHTFAQGQETNLANTWQRLQLKLPTPRTALNSLLTLELPAHTTVYLDDVRFLKPEDDLGGLEDGL